MNFIRDGYNLFDFFNKDKPCPQVIKNCENLRSSYIAELDALKTASKCSKCTTNSIKGKYMDLLKALLQ